ncbi:MAG: CPBP family intramembrane metalloprotease [Treponema sp.]|nr:CPBP family intramembrane metalloprotease [Treponema sp.]
MGIYIEALILYILLFFSGTAVHFYGISSSAAGFSASAELMKVFFYTIPALMLIWYLIVKAKTIEIWIIKPGKKDFKAAFLTYPFLLITGSIISFVSLYFNEPSEKIILNSPSTGFEWVILCLSFVLSAYLEESFFRFYIITKRQELNLTAPAALFLSVVLFSVCHIGAGPWSFLNAVLCGAFFGFIFLRYNSFHGIAIAHFLYNITSVYLNTLNN